jgi:RNA-binding protein YhbY
MLDRRVFLKAAGSAIVCVASTPSLFAGNLTTNDEFIKDSILVSNLTKKDFSLNASEFTDLTKINRQLKEIRRIVGYGNFNLIGIDEAILYARRYSRIGKLSKKELDILEKLFYHSASDYGFYGEKVLQNISDNIKKKETIKVPHTGHYLFKDKSVHLYEKIKREIGAENISLTSGVRGVVKQTQLFVSKIINTKGNVSLASRSLAPPGYSYHGIGDFDIGKVGFGYRNFTEDFAKTDEFKKLMDLGYISIRYPLDNQFGVRFEPWHIKVI